MNAFMIIYFKFKSDVQLKIGIECKRLYQSGQL